MKIIVKSKKAKKIRLWLPTRLLLSKTIARIAKRHLNADIGRLNHLVPEEKLDDALKALRNMKRNHPGIPLVEAKSADGDYVLISM